MMTLLSIVFLIASFPFQGIALAAKTASAMVKANKVAITPRIKQAGVKRKKLLQVFKRNKKITKKSNTLLERLEKTKEETSKARVLKHRKLDTKIATVKSKVVKDTDNLKQSKKRVKTVSGEENTLKATKYGLQLAEYTQKALHISANGIALLFKGMSRVFSLLIPIDVYVTLAVFVLVVVSGVVSVVFTNGGIADPSVQAGQESNKDDVYVDEDGNIVENPESDENTYKQVEDSGWIILSQNDERWISSLDIEIKDCSMSASTKASYFCSIAMVLTYLNTDNKVITPDQVVSYYQDKFIKNYPDNSNLGILANNNTFIMQCLYNFNIFTYKLNVTDMALSDGYFNDVTDEQFFIMALGYKANESVPDTWASIDNNLTYVVVYKLKDKLRVVSPISAHEDTTVEQGDSTKKPYSGTAFTESDLQNYYGNRLISFIKSMN